MGRGAAQAFYEENSSWLDGPEDAYEALYGNDEPKIKKRKLKYSCRSCQKRFKTEQGRNSHERDVHSKALGETGQ